MVDIEPVLTFDKTVSLPELRDAPELEDMALLRRGQRLSVQKVEENHFEFILQMAGHKLEDLS